MHTALKKLKFGKNSLLCVIMIISQFIMVTLLMSRVGDRNKYEIHLPLPPKIDPTVTMWQVYYVLSIVHITIFGNHFVDKVEEKPDVTYSDVGGCKEQIEKLKEVVETPLLNVSPHTTPSSVSIVVFFMYMQPEKYVNLGIDPPKGVLLFGSPGTGKTLCARAVANRTDACFIRVIGSELVQKYVGEVSCC